MTGRRDVDAVRAHAPEAPTALDYRVVEFGDMVELWALADVAICRAGASTRGRVDDAGRFPRSWCRCRTRRAIIR